MASTVHRSYPERAAQRARSWIAASLRAASPPVGDKDVQASRYKRTSPEQTSESSAPPSPKDWGSRTGFVSRHQRANSVCTGFGPKSIGEETCERCKFWSTAQRKEFHRSNGRRSSCGVRLIRRTRWTNSLKFTPHSSSLQIWSVGDTAKLRATSISPSLSGQAAKQLPTRKRHSTGNRELAKPGSNLDSGLGSPSARHANRKGWIPNRGRWQENTDTSTQKEGCHVESLTRVAFNCGPWS